MTSAIHLLSYSNNDFGEENLNIRSKVQNFSFDIYTHKFTKQIMKLSLTQKVQTLAIRHLLVLIVHRAISVVVMMERWWVHHLNVEGFWYSPKKKVSADLTVILVRNKGLFPFGNDGHFSKERLNIIYYLITSIRLLVSLMYVTSKHSSFWKHLMIIL